MIGELLTDYFAETLTHLRVEESNGQIHDELAEYFSKAETAHLKTCDLQA